MIESKGCRSSVRLIALFVLGLASGAIVPSVQAQSQYFNSAATTGTYSWDGNVWSAGNSNVAPYTSTWTQGLFARFYVAAGTSTTPQNDVVTVSNTEQNVGMYLNSTYVNLTINQASGTSGNLDVLNAIQGFLISSSTDSLVINAPITGTGGVEQESSGSLSLYGANTYSGGTETTGGQILYYNSNNSFGASTGSITFAGTTGQGMVNNGPSGLVIPNNLVFMGTSSSAPTNYNSITNFSGGNASGSTPGTTWTGSITLPSTTSAVTTLESGTATSVDEFTGTITGGSSLKFLNPGTIILAGASAATYTGTTTLTAGTLKFGAANTIAGTTSLVLSGGTLNPGGFNQAMTSTTLGLTATSTIDFGAGASEVDFANSAGLSWTGTLNLVNYNSAVDLLRFGNGNTGLTATQLAKITFNGAGAGTATLDANGFLVEPSAAAPEPAMLLPLLGAGLMIVRCRRARN